jgi:Tfp pilus assembly protein FimT
MGDAVWHDPTKMRSDHAPRIVAGAHAPRFSMRWAHTLPELVLTITLLAILSAITVPPLAGVTSRWRVRAASTDIVNALVLAREVALARGVSAAFVVDAPRGEIRVTCGGDTVVRRAISAQHGVTIAASGDTVRYAPDGLATGVSNMTVLVVHCTRIDSIVVSRLGRVRWVE